MYIYIYTYIHTETMMTPFLRNNDVNGTVCFIKYLRLKFRRLLRNKNSFYNNQE